ncbi:hypothetical protein LTR17_024847 [Elasticomyces elasticus]|nr:hypothetical protein LTR17_024847 [Elasticomyces elasticus]
MAPSYTTGCSSMANLSMLKLARRSMFVDLYTEQTVAHIPVAAAADVNTAVAAAKRAQPAWAARPASARAAVLRKFADLMQQNVARIAELDRVCLGKPVAASVGEIEGACDLVRFFSGQAELMYGQTSLSRPGQLNITLRQPFGVVAAIIPWNFPTLLFCHEVPVAVPAMRSLSRHQRRAHSAESSLGSWRWKPAFPPGIINVLSGAESTGELLASHMNIRKMSFTRSIRADEQ